jgi:hypothetical protein
MKTRHVSFLVVILIFSSVIHPQGVHAEIPKASSTIGDPIKWAVIIMGGYDYYRNPTYNAIQRIEKVMQGRGVPFDLFPDTNITFPTDTPSYDKYPLQYANGSLRYQVIVVLLDWVMNTNGTNQKYIYWAVGNGTNSVIFSRAAQVVPDLLGIKQKDVGFIWAQKKVSCNVSKTFNDGIEEYTSGSIIQMGAPMEFNAILHNSTGKTVWLNATWDDKWSVGMMNGTYYSGSVWYIQWALNEYKMDDADMKYTETWDTQNFGLWAHAINFALNNAEKIPVSILPYKRWKGAWVLRVDTDQFRWDDRWLMESAFKNGWIWDFQFSALGYGRSDVHPLLLVPGVPEGYFVQNSTVMYTTITGVLQTSLNSTDYEAIIYRNETNGCFDRIRIDFNKDKTFSDDAEYRLWDNITYPTVQGILYWCTIAPNATNPEMINVAWRQTPMLFNSVGAKEKFVQYAHEYDLSYSLHGWQHTLIPNMTFGSYGLWNGTDFVLDTTYIKQQFNEARYWMNYSFGPTGNGFEENEVIISHPQDLHSDSVDSAINELPWVLFSYSPGYSIGFVLKSDADHFQLICSKIEDIPSAFNTIQEIVQTLYPVISTYQHTTFLKITEIYATNGSISFPPYSDSIKPTNPRDAFHFWLSSKQMLEHVENAYYKDGRIILEFQANDSLTDFVWKFPIEYDSKFFSGFSDNRTTGKIKYFDGKNVYIEFSQGKGGQKLEAIYGTTPYIYSTSSYAENIAYTYVGKNLTIHITNATSPLNLKVNCLKLGRPDLVEVEGRSVEYDYDPNTTICSFNTTLEGTETAELIWKLAPPNQPSLLTPTEYEHYDPNASVRFAWKFSDPDQDDYQLAFRLQIDDDRSFESPLMDTGKVLSSSEEITVHTPNTIGLYFWRVKTWDTRDVEGEWSEFMLMVVDKLTVSFISVTDNRTDVGNWVDVKIKVLRDYGNTLFGNESGTVYINNTAAVWDNRLRIWRLSVKHDSVGEFFFKVSSIEDTKYNIKTTNDLAGSAAIIWDQIVITLVPSATNVSVGERVDFNIMATYAYDHEQARKCNLIIYKDGVLFATSNFSDTSLIFGTHQYSVERVFDSEYGLNAFNSNTVEVTWTKKTFTQKLMEWLFDNYILVVIVFELVAFLIYIIAKEQKQHGITTAGIICNFLVDELRNDQPQ